MNLMKDKIKSPDQKYPNLKFKEIKETKESTLNQNQNNKSLKTKSDKPDTRLPNRTITMESDANIPENHNLD